MPVHAVKSYLLMSQGSVRPFEQDGRNDNTYKMLSLIRTHVVKRQLI